MTTQYTTILKLALPVQGELSGTWGDVVNDNITQMVEQAIAGKATVNSWTANAHTLTTADGTTAESRCAILELTDTGTALTGAGTVTCPTNTKLYIVDNNTAQIVTVKTSGGTGVAVPVGKTMLVYCDGTNVVEGVTHANSLSLGTSTVTADKILDEDNMSSDSATALATQQSIKAYVDSQVGTVDTLSEILANGNTTGGTDIAVGTGDDITFADNSKAIFGDSSDLQIYHGGGNSVIEEAGAGNLIIRGSGNVDIQPSGGGAYMARFAASGASSLYYNNAEKIATTATGIDVTGDVSLPDNGKATFGAGDDLQIYHNGNNSFIEDSGTGSLYVRASLDFRVQSHSDNKDMIKGTSSGAVTLYYDNAAKLATTATGIDVTGVITTDGMTTSADINFADNGKAIFGAGDDLQIYHNGNNSFIDDAGTGNLQIRANAQIKLQKYTGENMFVGIADGAASMYYDNSQKIATTATGVDITGTAAMDGLTASASTADYIASITNSNGTDAGGGLFVSTRWNTSANSVAKFVSNSGSNVVANFAGNGDISFYEDTGTTPKFFWDASAESLSVPTLSITDGSITTTAAAGDHTVFNSTGADADFRVRTGANTHSLYVEGNTGNVGIGVSAPNEKLESSGAIRVLGTTATSANSGTLSFNGTLFNIESRGPDTSNRGTIGLYQATSNGGSGIQSMLIDASGNVAIGTDSPAFTSGSGLRIERDATATLRLQDTGAHGFEIRATASAAEFFSANSKPFTFDTGGAERMRIDSSGNLLVGKTSTGAATAGIELNGANDLVRIARDGGVLQELNRITSDGDIIEFRKDNAAVGSISVTASATAYNTSSDQRLKENIADADDAGSKIDAIQVRKFDWKADGFHQDYGMVAQELIEVAPEAVSAPEDPEDMMGVDYSKLVPMMLKEIQSLRARVAQLES